jgi:hypothetical protein
MKNDPFAPAPSMFEVTTVTPYVYFSFIASSGDEQYPQLGPPFLGSKFFANFASTGFVQHQYESVFYAFIIWIIKTINNKYMPLCFIFIIIIIIINYIYLIFIFYYSSFFFYFLYYFFY